MITSKAGVRQPRGAATSKRSKAAIDLPFRPVLRKLGPVETDQIEAHVLRLDDSDRRMRYCGLASDQAIVAYCQKIDWPRTIVLGCFVDGTLRGMAELKTAAATSDVPAELAITVERAFQNNGIGTKMIRKMLTIARNRFIRKVYMICLLENQKMQRVAGKLEAELTFCEGEAEASIWPSVPTYLSLIEEVSMDGQALWRAMFDSNMAKPVNEQAEHLQ